ncbi:hypothetical protein ACT4US_10805, partial [Bacillus sp. HC-Mk]
AMKRHTRKIAIIGTGLVGSSCAYSIFVIFVTTGKIFIMYLLTYTKRKRANKFARLLFPVIPHLIDFLIAVQSLD